MLYNNSRTYNAAGVQYNSAITSNGVYPGLRLNLNRVIGITDPKNFLDEASAANIWAGTKDLSLVGALNFKAGTEGIELNLVCDLLSSSKYLDADGASKDFA